MLKEPRGVDLQGVTWGSEHPSASLPCHRTGELFFLLGIRRSSPVGVLPTLPSAASKLKVCLVQWTSEALLMIRRPRGRAAHGQGSGARADPDTRNDRGIQRGKVWPHPSPPDGKKCHRWSRAKGAKGNTKITEQWTAVQHTQV
jgi:hypothetical protein